MINLYRAIDVSKSPEGLQELGQKGLTYSNKSPAQYTEDDGMTDWGDFGGNPFQKVDGLPVFLNLAEAKGWLANPNSPRNFRGADIIPLIAHVALPDRLFTEGFLEVYENDLNKNSWRVSTENLQHHQEWVQDGRPKNRAYRPEWGGHYHLTDFEGRSGEHFVPNYPLEDIRRESWKDYGTAPVDYLRFYTPSMYMINGTLPKNSDVPTEIAQPEQISFTAFDTISYPLIEVDLSEMQRLL